MFEEAYYLVFKFKGKETISFLIKL